MSFPSKNIRWVQMLKDFTEEPYRTASWEGDCSRAWILEKNWIIASTADHSFLSSENTKLASNFINLDFPNDFHLPLPDKSDFMVHLYNLLSHFLCSGKFTCSSLCLFLFTIPLILSWYCFPAHKHLHHITLFILLNACKAFETSLETLISLFLYIYRMQPFP